MASQYMPPSGGEQGAAEDVRERVEERAGQVASRAAGQVRGQIDSRSTQVAGQIGSIADALQGAGEHLRREGNDGAGRAAHRLAGRMENFSSYLRESSSDRLLGDVEQFARQRPWLATGIGATVGFMAARFVKASAESRYAGLPTRQAGPDQDWPLTREAQTTVAIPPLSYAADLDGDV